MGSDTCISKLSKCTKFEFWSDLLLENSKYCVSCSIENVSEGSPPQSFMQLHISVSSPSKAPVSDMASLWLQKVPACSRKARGLRQHRLLCTQQVSWRNQHLHATLFRGMLRLTVPITRVNDFTSSLPGIANRTLATPGLPS